MLLAMDARAIFEASARLLRERRALVMVTVIDAQGSTPREVGARMLWTPEEGFLGTVGGGQFEELVKDAIERAYAARTTLRERIVLAAEAEQCCGGVMEVLVEFLGARQRVVMFGAGHVSQALARLLESAPLELVVVDDRAEWNNAARFPSARIETDFARGVAICLERPEATMACVMTCSHDRDLEIVRALLESPPAYLGLIGSRSKRACFFSRLSASGVGASSIERVRCPMGLGDMGKAPGLVAVSIAGELLLRSREIGTL